MSEDSPMAQNLNSESADIDSVVKQKEAVAGHEVDTERYDMPQTPVSPDFANKDYALDLGPQDLYYRECLREIRNTFNVVLVLLVISTLIILAGIICIFIFGLVTGILAVSGGVVSSIIDGIIFTFNMSSKARLGRTAKELSALRRVSEARRLIDEISDSERRDTQLEKLIHHLLEPTSESENM